MPDHSDVANVQRLLSQIPAACSRNDWVKTLAAIKNHLRDDGRSVAEDWSRTAPDMFDAADFDRTWNSIEPDRGTSGTATLGSLIHIAAHGHSGGSGYGDPGAGGPENANSALHDGLPDPHDFGEQRSSDSPPPPGSPGGFALAGEKAPTNPDAPNPRGKVVERYQINDWDGTHIATHLRYEDGGRPWVAPDNGPLTTKANAPYFNCDLLIRALAAKREFFIVMVEGEKCAKAFQSCFRGGDGDAIVIGTFGATWRPLESHVERLVQVLDRIDEGKQNDSEIVCWADNDKVGVQHMEGMIALLHEAGYPKPIKLIKAGNRKGYDVVDWINNKQSPPMDALYNRAVRYAPPQYIVDRHPRYGKQQETQESTRAKSEAASNFADAKEGGASEQSPPPPQGQDDWWKVPRVPTQHPGYGGKFILQQMDLLGFAQAMNALQIRARFDTLSEDYEISYRTDPDNEFYIGTKSEHEYCNWRIIDNRIYQLIQSFIITHCVTQSSSTKDGEPVYKRAKFAIASVKDYLDAYTLSHRFNPVTNWLETELPAWDGKSRMTTMLNDMFGCGDNRGPLMDWASVHMLMTVVHRAYNPGYQIPQVVILVGRQGTGKSELLKQLLPPKYRNEWFNDTFHLDWETKQQLEAIRGRIIVEIADMAGLRKTENDRLKSFITSSDDGGIRDPYERRAVKSRPRTAVLIGTSDRVDEASLPYDPAGYRRFVPVTFAHGCNVQEFMDNHRDQLWAEALHYYNQGLDPNIRDAYTIKLQDEATHQHAPINEVAEDKAMDLPGMIAEYYNVQPPPEGSALKLSDIMKAMGMDERAVLSVANQKRVGPELRKLGWVSKKNVRRENYVKPGPPKNGNWWIAPKSDD